MRRSAASRSAAGSCSAAPRCSVARVLVLPQTSIETGYVRDVNAQEAVAVLLDAAPEFRPVYDDNTADYAGDDGEPMLHILFGDLANFYEREVAGKPELASRFWRAVEELASKGGRYVADDALAGSFIEHFCLGDDHHKGMIEGAAPEQGAATRALVEWYWRRNMAAGQRLERRREGIGDAPDDDSACA
jgi:hypothetical protein